MHDEVKTSFMTRFLQSAFHPILISCFPILYLAKANLSQINPEDVLRPLGFAVVVSALVLGLMTLILQKLDSAALITSMSSLLFFSYGHMYNVIKNTEIMGIIIGRHRYLLVLWTLFFLIGAYLITRKFRVLDWLTTLASTMSLIMFGLSLSLFLSSLLNDSRGHTSLSVDDLSLAGEPPDIYYIVVDSYSRSDNLQEYYDFDNSGFTDFLQQQGFYVADSSQANYLFTALSVSSSLNMDTVQNIDPNWVQGTEANPREWIINNRVRLNLEALGYSIVNLASGWKYTEWLDADYVLTPDMSQLDTLLEGGFFTPFEGLLIESTMVKALIDLEALRGTSASRFIQARMQAGITFQREIILAQFENLSTSTSISGPKFVFAHIISPHAPYFFGPNGEARIPEGSLNLFEDEDRPIEEREQLYIDQLRYVNTRLREVMTAILAENDGPTIIILQSDHGHSFFENEEGDSSLASIRDRAGIFNAYYLPEHCRDDLYPSITPINTFRVVFNCQFNGDFQLLEDITWYGEHGYLPIEEVIPGFYE